MLLGKCMCDREEERRLANPGLAGEQHHLACHEAPANDAIELAGAGRDTPYPLLGYLRHRLGGTNAGGGPAGLAGPTGRLCGDFSDRAELLALGAAADPPK